jgi:hypothetical protein
MTDEHSHQGSIVEALQADFDTGHGLFDWIRGRNCQLLL